MPIYKMETEKKQKEAVLFWQGLIQFWKIIRKPGKSPSVEIVVIS